jgi:hypothetical protein
MVCVQVLLCLIAVRGVLPTTEGLDSLLSASHPDINPNQSGAYV